MTPPAAYVIARAHDEPKRRQEDVRRPAVIAATPWPHHGTQRNIYSAADVGIHRLPMSMSAIAKTSCPRV